jgi:acetoin utilization deacetylase AcuC-like enzyme
MAWGARNVISTQVVLRVHDFDYLSRVATHVEALQRAESGVSEATETKRTLLRCVSTTLTGDTFACARSLHAALCASYTVCKAIDTVVRGEYRNAFCVVRPPGHHAGQSGSTRKDQKAPDEDEPGLVGQGFCLINHVAVGARHALARHGSTVKKVVVIDWDLHHGNGTEQILSDPDGPLAREGLRDRVLFCSIHGAGPDDAPLYPGTARSPSTTPALNVPLKRGSGPAEFLRGFQQILDASEAFGPDLILISAGFDAHKDDMFRFLRLNDQCYRDMTKRVMDLAYRVCGGRIVSLLEGGYTISTLVRCSVVHARALATYGQPGAVAGITPASRQPVRRPAPQREEEPSRKRARRAPKKMDV